MLQIIVGSYTSYGLQVIGLVWGQLNIGKNPDHKIFEAHPSMNSDLLNFLKLGKITPHPDISKFDGSTVEFVDGKREAFDVVVFATGYYISRNDIGKSPN